MRPNIGSMKKSSEAERQSVSEKKNTVRIETHLDMFFSFSCRFCVVSRIDYISVPLSTASTFPLFQILDMWIVSPFFRNALAYFLWHEFILLQLILCI